MQLIYIHHSGFVISGEGFSLLIDYYQDTPDLYVHEQFLRHPGRLYIFSSHSHGDHFNPEILEWQKKRPDIQYILAEEIREHQPTFPPDTVFLRKGDEWSDTVLKVKAFGSTDIGISFLIDVDGQRIFHAGDLNNWHWQAESTPEEVKEAENNYLTELNEISRYTTYADIVFFPTDPRLGDDYTRGARQFLDRIKTGLFVPMHFWKKYAKANAFEEYVTAKGGKFMRIEREGEKRD